MADLRTFHGPNAGYVLDLYERYLAEPEAVGGEWRKFFQDFDPRAGAETAAVAPTSAADHGKALAAYRLAAAVRRRGHTAARLDPLNEPPAGDPALDPDAHGLTEGDLTALPASVVDGPLAREAGGAADAIRRLRDVYTGTVGYEFDHIQDAEERSWLRDAVESGAFRTPLSDEERVALLRRLSAVEGLEQYLHRAFFGQKRFSVEGTDMLVPVLDELVERAAAAKTGEVVIGMAHRGRLNVLAHVMEKPYEEIVAGFTGSGPAAGDEHRTGDVKYHLGWRGRHAVNGTEVAVTLAPNPSHLEFVNPVVVGMARAAQDGVDEGGEPRHETSAALAVLVHGDAAFPGQGVVAETLNLARLPGYDVGGTLHVIANNQVGFTTDPDRGRSTRYASDIAKGFEAPVVHVNADDPEACLAVARLASAYRERFSRDFVIDLIGYRRWGHNEGDEPAFTQPTMYRAIGDHPTVRRQWAERLASDGLVDADAAAAMLREVTDALGEVKDRLEGKGAAAADTPSTNSRGNAPEPETAVSAERLRALNDALLNRPEGFAPHKRLDRLLQRRAEALDGEPKIDWGHAEALAFATLLEDGVPVRLTGQDAERGTFSHRHAVLHDAETGALHTPLSRLDTAKATFAVHNDPLSEMAAVGFNYGYTVRNPDALVLWEAQFGDFVNGAQVMLDQFISAGYAKWGQRSGLVMLLPHGYEGQGPEHSSARLERFLQLAAEQNIRVANCTTAAQYFHLLRRQAASLEVDARPLIVMSPKSLLRHPQAASTIDDLTAGAFRPVLPDETADHRADHITRLVLCSGKVHVDLAGSDEREAASRVALARVEELYPLPEDRLSDLIGGFPALEEVVWVQEEPRNMGAWSYMESHLRALSPEGVAVRYEGRPERASPAEGNPARHAAEQARIVKKAFADAPEPAAKRKKRQTAKASS